MCYVHAPTNTMKHIQIYDIFSKKKKEETNVKFKNMF